MFILCNLTGTEEPDKVSIVETNSARHVRNILPVVKITQQPTMHMFSACVSPMHSNFSDTAQLTEWVELNRMLGIKKFTFYINSVSKNVRNILEYYEHKGLAVLLPWTLPKKLADLSHKRLHYYGQLAALNDCLYRSKGRSLYLSSTDLDEFIIPQKPTQITWSDMLSRLPSKSVYIIRCSFFSQKRSCSRKIKCRERLTIDSHKVRDNIVLGSHKRSKYIAKTSELITMGIHFIWELHTGSEYTVNPKIALLHHYRKDDKRYTSVKNAYRKIPHKTAGKYSTSLHKRLKNITNEFDKVSNISVHK
ncbi:beta-1,4-galactosyltransferase galt-1-like [Mercenaria mercenaria]|uniref:beta-1,4-galactosyltransferase galt-1-like n=1 Tax=Mercenaria mercenaria TaxID=6596 RepID=UPI00234E7FC3|nr:beta-1,4-galactosyltransferase galt-1-like [Mercenaria mercenaria]